MREEKSNISMPFKTIKWRQGQRNSTAGKVFALHPSDLGLIPIIPHGPLSLLGMILEHRANSNL